VAAAVCATTDECFTATANGGMFRWEDGAIVASASIPGRATSMAVAAAPVVAVGSDDGRVRIYDASAPSALHLMHIAELHTAAVTHVAFTAGGEHIMSVGGGSLVFTSTRAPFRPQAFLPVPAGCTVLRLHATRGPGTTTEVTAVVARDIDASVGSLLLLLSVPAAFTASHFLPKSPLELAGKAVGLRQISAPGSDGIVCAVQAKQSLLVLLADGGLRE